MQKRVRPSFAKTVYDFIIPLIDREGDRMRLDFYTIFIAFVLSLTSCDGANGTEYVQISGDFNREQIEGYKK